MRKYTMIVDGTELDFRSTNKIAEWLDLEADERQEMERNLRKFGEWEADNLSDIPAVRVFVVGKD